MKLSLLSNNPRATRRNGRAGSTAGLISAVRQAGPVQFGDLARPFAELDQPRFQLGHSPRWTSPVQSSSANGRAGSTTDPARPFAELDQPRIQLGRSPSWINHGFSSAVRRAGPVHLGDRTSRINHGFQRVVVDALTAIWARVSRCRCSSRTSVRASSASAA
ncbi:hypothetical protein F2Q68_00039273 [Brassica cretica]|uniref:Uncharacterized protein n=1 Tax=Brassica cretica TaxID=69181 RepID=A0A8S9MSQ7_BRACR|nr:hypothetical protein F2Q68_00039273 [Brassica cretica]